MHAVRAIADIAAIGVTNRETKGRDQERAAQQQRELNARVVIEQATGVIAERMGVNTANAFERLRSAARASGRAVADVATDVVSRRTSRNTAHRL